MTTLETIVRIFFGAAPFCIVAIGVLYILKDDLKDHKTN